MYIIECEWWDFAEGLKCYSLCYRQAILQWVTGITQSMNPQTGFILNGTESEMMTPENSSQLQKQLKTLIPNCRLLCWSWGPDEKVGRSGGVVERAVGGALSGLATRWPRLWTRRFNFLVLKCSCRHLPRVVLYPRPQNRSASVSFWALHWGWGCTALSARIGSQTLDAGRKRVPPKHPKLGA